MIRMKSNLRWLFFLPVAGLLTGCSSDSDAEQSFVKDDIRFAVSTDWQSTGGTRAAVYDQVTSLQTDGQFKAYAYVHGSKSMYINGSTVSYNGNPASWNFDDGKHYWPMVETLDFLAFMPVTRLDYITDSKFAEDNSPLFSCDLTSYMTSASQPASMKEFIFAFTPNQSKAEQGASGVAINFMHPLAVVNVKLSKAHPNVTIKNITFKGLKTGGDFGTVYDAGAMKYVPQWTSVSGSADFVASYNSEYADATATYPLQIGGPYLVVPQNFEGGKQTIEVSFSEYGVEDTLEAEVAMPQWLSGHSYTYTFTIDGRLKVTAEIDSSINPWTKW